MRTNLVGIPMAFQSEANFAAWLRGAAAGAASAGVTAAAANFLLEERLSAGREIAYLTEGPAGTPPPWNDAEFQTAYGNHFSRNVGVSRLRPRECHTFQSPLNDSALLTMESHRDVVRLESVKGLFDLNTSVFLTVDELTAALRDLAAHGPAALSVDERERLQLWLDGANDIRDTRPSFVAPWGELEPLLREPDWATLLRNTLGLVHLGGTPDAPLTVVLMRYNLSRSEAVARKARLARWAATPTVLEAGNQRGPSPAFFPYPPAALSAGELGFGQTVDLGAGDGLSYKPELLHFRIDYELADFHRIGELVDRVDDPQLATARQRHLGLLENDLRHRADVP